MKPISCNQEMGDTKRLLCPGAPQGPAPYHSPLIASVPLLPGLLFTRLSPLLDCVFLKHHDLVFVIFEFPAPQQCQAYGTFSMNIHELSEPSCLLLAALESYTQMPK